MTATLTVAEQREALELAAEIVRRNSLRKLATFYPDEGPYRRELYPKHMEFFRAGKTHRERGFIAANRVGKTEGAGGYETALHLTGLYPSWWEGRVFPHAIDGWACGTTNVTTRDIVQEKLLGPINALGTGLIPGELIVGEPTRKRSVADAIETVRVRHVNGALSTLTFKSYESGREVFEGTEKDLVWCDEEPSEEIWTECLTRTMDTKGRGQGGIMMGTFTPLKGLSAVVLAFLPGGKVSEGPQTGQKYVVMAGWDDVPHLSATEKAALLESYPLSQRKARTKGVPQLGSGAIYPVDEEEIVVDPFPLPAHFARVYALDVGWNRTAALWMAVDREPVNPIGYLYSEHYRGQAEPSIHADAIKGRGAWIPGVIDPAARGRSQIDGEKLFQMYRDLGLHLTPAKNAVEAGVNTTLQMLSTGRIKVFRTLQNFLAEYRIYRRDEKGVIVKKGDHLMDDLRYLVLNGFTRAITEAEATARVNPNENDPRDEDGIAF